MNQAKLLATPLLAAMLSPTALHAQDGDSVEITPYADLRYRLELVDQEGVPEDATASTVRLKAGVRLGDFKGLSALVEGEAIVRVGPEHYNDTTNSLTQYPVVADPSDVVLNQAYLRYRPSDSFEAVAGRQVINIDNQRWIGSVGWRQNDQTFDAGRITVSPIKPLTVQYVHAWRVNRIFGPDSAQGIWHDPQIDAINLAYKIDKVGTLTGYGYWLDLPEAAAMSSRTLGVRFVGDQLIGTGAKLLYAAEYAHQIDLAPNPREFGHDYMFLETGVSANGFTVKAGYERLEGDGTTALQTPLATLHAFNGWADLFLTTPANGLRDIYGDLAYKFADGPVKGLTLRAIYHDFRSTVGGIGYGSEFDALAAYPVTKNVSVLAKYARYNADSFASDRSKVWFSVEAKF